MVTKGSQMSPKGPEMVTKGPQMPPKWHPKGGDGAKKVTKIEHREPLGRPCDAKAPKWPKRAKLRDSILEHFGTKMAPKMHQKFMLKKQRKKGKVFITCGLILGCQNEAKNVPKMHKTTTTKRT